MLTYKIRDNDSSYAVVATDGNETEPIHVTGEHQNAKILIGVLTDNESPDKDHFRCQRSNRLLAN